MMTRLVLTALALWVLLLGPGLCMAGTIEHACPGCEQETTCEHEDACPDDPCETQLLRPDGTSIVIAAAPIASVPPSLLAAASSACTTGSRAATGPSHPNLPRPTSDRPLLI